MVCKPWSNSFISYRRALILPWVQDAQDKYSEPHDALGVPPLQVWGRQDGFLCADDHHSCLVLHLQGGQCGGCDLLEDTQKARIASPVWGEEERQAQHLNLQLGVYVEMVTEIESDRKYGTSFADMFLTFTGLQHMFWEEINASTGHKTHGSSLKILLKPFKITRNALYADAFVHSMEESINYSMLCCCKSKNNTL